MPRLFVCGDDTLNKNTPAEATSETDFATDVITLGPQAIVSEAPESRSGVHILGNPAYPAICYGAWRSDVRESGPLVPTIAQQKEDLKIMAAMGIKILRTYNTQCFIGLDGKSNTENLLTAIAELMAEDESFEMYLMLGVWVQALGAYTDAVDKSTEDALTNRAEMDKAIELAKAYPEIIKVIAIGNEAMVDWQEHDLPIRFILGYVNELQALKASGDINNAIWITSSDNHAVWAGTDSNAANQITDLNALIAAVDYISLHTYPFHDTYHNNDFWFVDEDKTDFTDKEKVDAAMVRAIDRAIKEFKAAQCYMLSLGINKPIHIGETGWASETNELYGIEGSKAADEYKQKIFYDAMSTWSNEFGASLFFFEAFDEPWKGGADNPGDSEKHFGLIDINSQAKYVIWERVDNGIFDDLTRLGMKITKTFNGNEHCILESVLVPDVVLTKGNKRED